MFIYLIVNHETGKYYIGQHKGDNLKKYLQQKFHHAQAGVSSNSRLYRSMRKHPDPKSWSIHALRSGITDRAELDQIEKDFIAFLKATDPEYGYNICRGGEGFTGPHSQETRARMAETHRETWTDPQRRLKQSNTIKKGYSDHPERHTELSKAVKKTWATPGFRTKAGKAIKDGLSRSEVFAKIGETRKQAWDDPTYCLKVARGKRQAWLDPDKRRRMVKQRVEASRKRWSSQKEC
jgi:hypothetical protein